MKAKILSASGEAGKEIELPSCFEEKVRADLIQKAYESSKRKQPYAPYLLAGMQHSASGIIRHARRKWKGAYGYGIARVPRKIMSRSGNRFSWIGAEIASARGGRQAHPPKVVAMQKGRKVNKKELRKTLRSALAASSSYDLVKKNYPKLKKIILPLIFESKITELKTKDLHSLFTRILDAHHAEKILIVTATSEKMKCRTFETAPASALQISQLAAGGRPGRLLVFTEKAIDELKKL